MTQNTKVGIEQGGDRLFVKSGGTINVEAGATINVEAGGTFANAGTVAHTGTQTFDDIIGNDASLAITGAAAADATSAGGAVAIAGAAGGATSGTGGAGTITGGAGTGGNSAGGVASATGGAGQGSAAGGVGRVVGGLGGATGAGGAAQVTGGAGGATSGAGGASSVSGGAGTAGNGNGGQVVIAGGAPHGTGKAGIASTRSIVTKSQGAPAAKTVTAAITAAELVAGLITTTGATGPSVHQLPTGTLIDAELPGIATGDSFDFHIINTGVGANDDATITVNTDVTIIGNPTVGALTDATIISGSATFRARRSAANTYVVYRIS